MRFLQIFIIFIFLNFIYGLVIADELAQMQSFAQFSARVPAGWSGDEATGFISDDPKEYMLTFTRKKDDAIEAQVSIYLLPNKPHKNAEESALILSESQGNPTRPVKENNFWTFLGEPRTRTLKASGQTWVNANSDWLLIIMAQDPGNTGASTIVKSLSGLTPQSSELLNN